MHENERCIRQILFYSAICDFGYIYNQGGKKASILTDQPAFPYSQEAANLFHKEEF